MHDEPIIIQLSETVPVASKAPFVVSLLTHAMFVGGVWLGMQLGWKHNPITFGMKPGVISLNVPDQVSQAELEPEQRTIEIPTQPVPDAKLDAPEYLASRTRPDAVPLDALELPSELASSSSQGHQQDKISIRIPPAYRPAEKAEPTERKPDGPRQPAITGQRGSQAEHGQESAIIAQINNAPPIFPPQLIQQGISGKVLLELVIAPDGQVTQVTIIESSGQPLFDAAAVVAARHWRGVPMIRDGKPVETITFQPIYFNHPRNPLPIQQ